MEGLACFVQYIHLVGCTTTSADSGQFFLLHFVCDFRNFALLAADPFHDELIQMSREIFESMLTLHNGGTFGVGADLCTEVFENSTFGDTESSRHIRQVLDVGLYTVETTLLTQLHLRHLVTIVRVIIL